MQDFLNEGTFTFLCPCDGLFLKSAGMRVQRDLRALLSIKRQKIQMSSSEFF